MMMQTAEEETTGSGWRAFYKVGGAAVLIAVLVALAEIAITFLPEASHASQRTVTVADWFTLFHNNWFLGLRNLGLLNLIGTALLTPAFLAMYFAQRRENEPWAALGAILFFMGMAVYIASNRGFAMLSLSSQYASAATDAQRAALIAAGQTMLVEGLNRVGLFLIDAAGLVISAVMLRSKVFGKAAATAGILGNGLMIVFEIILAFAPAWFNVGLVIAICGGVSIMAWWVLVGRRLLRMGADHEDAPGLR
jgi:hypothetical protein